VSSSGRGRWRAEGVTEEEVSGLLSPVCRRCATLGRIDPFARLTLCWEPFGASIGDMPTGCVCVSVSVCVERMMEGFTGVWK